MLSGDHEDNGERNRHAFLFEQKRKIQKFRSGYDRNSFFVQVNFLQRVPVIDTLGQRNRCILRIHKIRGVVFFMGILVLKNNIYTDFAFVLKSPSNHMFLKQIIIFWLSMPIQWRY